MPLLASPVPKPAELSVCLFCGSSDAADPGHLAAAAAFGAELARARVRLVYGGGGIGLMGAAAKAAHAAGGRVLGVMPDFLRRLEVIYDEVDTLVVPDMHERKRVMFEQSDAFAVFPGGIGTLEEVVEILSWKRLGLHAKPVLFVDLNGFWRPFYDLIHHVIGARLAPSWMAETWVSVTEVKEAVAALKSAVADATDLQDRQVVQKA